MTCPATATESALPTGRRRGARTPDRRRVLLALVLVGVAYASVIQSFSWNQTSHYDLIRALNSGTARIDPYQANTGDKAFYHGHFYSARAPGLALLSVPWYRLLQVVDARHLAVLSAAQKSDDELIWMVGLWANVLPALALLILVWRVAERYEPGFGAAAALTAGLGTLLLPLSTLLFSHVLGAFLAFAAFALLLRERDGPPRGVLLGASGLLIGVALTVEYPTLFVGTVLGIYALARRVGSAWSLRRAARRAVAYGAGVGIGVAPLAAYDQLTFGSLTHVAYHDIAHNQTGFFGIRAPDLSGAYALLFDSRGLLTLAPVLILALAGIVLMHRRGWRGEALVIASVFAVYLIYNSGYFLPFGGGIMGPRFLTTTLPFLAVPLALAFRRFPGPTIALAAVSVVTYSLATLTHPLIGYEGETVEWTRLARMGFFQPTFATMLGLGRGWVAPVPFVALVAIAVGLVASVTPRVSIPPRALLWGAFAVGTWALLAVWAPHALGIDTAGLRKIVEAGDHTALNPPSFRPNSAHPLGALAAVAGATGLVALASARLLAHGARAGPDTRHGAPERF